MGTLSGRFSHAKCIFLILVVVWWCVLLPVTTWSLFLGRDCLTVWRLPIRLQYSGTSKIMVFGSKEKEEPDDQLFHWPSLTVKESDSGSRVDAFLARQSSELLVPALPASRSFFQTLLAEGRVFVNGQVAKKSQKVQMGQLITANVSVVADGTTHFRVVPQDIPLDVLYEDDWMVAVAKPAGLVVHPGPGHLDGTFANALSHHIGTKEKELGEGDARGVGVVHRLDKGTTGVLLGAKSTLFQGMLSSLFTERSVKKLYVAVCVGNPGNRRVNVPVSRHPQHRKRMVAVPQGMISGGKVTAAREAISHIKTVAFDGKLSVVEISIETGRTHQIRVHMQYLHTPILGDSLYGNSAWNRYSLSRYGTLRPMLHAHLLELVHPLTRRRLAITAPLPGDMTAVVARVFPCVERERSNWFTEGGAASVQQQVTELEKEEVDSDDERVLPVLGEDFDSVDWYE